MVNGVRRLMAFAALAMAVSCGPASGTVPGTIVTPALLPISISTPGSIVANRPTPFTIAGVAACRPSDLRVSLQAADPSYVGAGSPNTMWWEIDVRDAGVKPCFVAGTFHTSHLDCAHARPIPADGSETFDMHIDIPSRAHRGPATLIWSILGSPELYQEGTSYLPIT